MRSGGNFKGAVRRTMAKDAFSTPARRRRLIADLTKVLLKKYCGEACRNVARHRLESASANTIQRLAREYCAKIILARLKLKRNIALALIMQMCFRRYAARKCLRDLKLRWLLRRRRTAAILIQARWRMYLAKKYVGECRRLYLEKVARLRFAAAVKLQTWWRSFLHMKLLRVLKRAHYQEQQRKCKSAQLIQSIARRKLSYSVVRRLRRCKKARWIIRGAVMNWWRCRLRVRHKMSIRISRIIRSQVACVRYGQRLREVLLAREQAREKYETNCMEREDINMIVIEPEVIVVTIVTTIGNCVCADFASNIPSLIN